MRRIFAGFFGIWMSVTALLAQDGDAIETVIGNQLQAFNDRDLQEAWSYASPNIKRLFGTPDNFGVMVERGYPMVWDNTDVQFLELLEVNDGQIQKVMIRDANGTLHTLLYQMIETPRGWQINGVQLLPGAQLGA